jgi:periplasmic copper chaperone A
MTMRTLPLLLAALILLAPAMVRAQIDVTAPWARATAPGAQAGAAYLTMAVRDGAADRLLRAETPVAREAELHTHLMDGGVARMRKVDAVEVPPGAPLAFAPGGLHVMLLGLTRQLRPGETFPLTLVFERSGRVTTEVRVEGAGARGPSGHHGH